jgi:Zn-dependent metalloprotease
MLSAPVVRVVRVLGVVAACALVSVQALAIQPTNDTRTFKMSEGFVAADFDAQPSLVMIEAGKTAPPEMARFLGEQAGRWEVRWDTRNERPHLVQGSGIPLMPGAGNKLPRTARKPDLAQVERLVRAFMGRYPEMFRIAPESLRLDTSRSISYGPDARVWFIELQQYHDGVPVEGANVFFRINNGNIVQFGADRIADVGISAQPAVTATEARQRGLDTLGVEAAEVSKVVEPGLLKIYPVLTQGERSGEMYSGLAGFGYSHQLVWETTFRRAGDEGTYKMVVDAQTGGLLGTWDLNTYATVQGGIYPTTNTDAEVLQPFSFATVTNGTTKQTDAGGVYSYTGGTATATLNGQFFQMADNCGSISLSNSTTGDLNFGTSGGTDCTTPGVGGAGNTHASRTGFYHLTKINRKAITFLPGTSWLNSKVTANMNINLTCNAFWNGSTLNFYRSGGGCSNTGELAAVFLHEWGHGMDTNSGGSAPNDQGTGEAVGDTFAFIQTRDGCIGQIFQRGVNCATCTSCSGVRDVADFAVAGGATGTKIASPANVTANNGINCDRFSCPYLANGITPYQGPMGYEGHCESYIVSSANWDLAQSLVSTYGTEPGWSKMDQIWYGSLTPSKSGYRLVSGGKCNAAAVVDGCAATNWYTVYLPVDDDDGNLANGTPNACRIWDAFNAHGVACGTRPACSTGGPTPTPTNTPVPPTATPTPTNTPVGPTATPTNTPVPPTATPTPTGVTVLTNGVPVSGISGATGSQRFFSLAVPAGATNLRFTTTGGTDTDADLYVRFGSQPTTTVNDCKSETSTNNETCNIATAQAGTYFVLVYGFSAYSGVTLTGGYTVGSTPTPTATPGTGAQLMVNGGIEGSSSPWVLTATGSLWNATGTPHGGASYVRMGVTNNVNGSTSGVMYQTVSIPATAAGQLGFWLNVTSDESGTTVFDQLFVEVRSTTGTLLATLATFSNVNEVPTTSAYTFRGTYDVSAFRGQTVRIQFRATTDASLATVFRVDDVSLQ